MPSLNSPSSALGGLLKSLQKSFHQKNYLSSDPLEFVHRYSDPLDQEIVALIAALLAYGNVKQIRRSVGEALNKIEGLRQSPKLWVQSLSTESGRAESRRALNGWVHRFNVGDDLVLLGAVLSQSWLAHGSMGAQFVANLDPRASDISEALDALIRVWRKWAHAIDPTRASGSFSYFLTAPEDGSCCKRWCMFLRWMGRKDELDPGLWAQGEILSAQFPPGRWLRASQLVIPLDTHTGRISQYLALTKRKSLNWQAALEVTASLRRWDSDDPTRYDFALARLGILDLCQRKYKKEICTQCQLLPACRFARKKGIRG